MLSSFNVDSCSEASACCGCQHSCPAEHSRAARKPKPCGSLHVRLQEQIRKERFRTHVRRFAALQEQKTRYRWHELRLQSKFALHLLAEDRCDLVVDDNGCASWLRPELDGLLLVLWTQAAAQVKGSERNQRSAHGDERPRWFRRAQYAVVAWGRGRWSERGEREPESERESRTETRFFVRPSSPGPV